MFNEEPANGGRAEDDPSATSGAYIFCYCFLKSASEESVAWSCLSNTLAAKIYESNPT
jgi:hypothetical protein